MVLGFRLLKHALFHLFLAGDAVASPGNGFKPFGIDLVPTVDAFAEVTFADATQSFFDHAQELAVIVALSEKKLFSVGIRGAVGDILRGFGIGNPPVFLRARDHPA